MCSCHNILFLFISICGHVAIEVCGCKSCVFIDGCDGIAWYQVVCIVHVGDCDGGVWFQFMYLYVGRWLWWKCVVSSRYHPTRLSTAQWRWKAARSYRLTKRRLPNHGRSFRMTKTAAPLYKYNFAMYCIGRVTTFLRLVSLCTVEHGLIATS